MRLSVSQPSIHIHSASYLPTHSLTISKPATYLPIHSSGQIVSSLTNVMAIIHLSYPHYILAKLLLPRRGDCCQFIKLLENCCPATTFSAKTWVQVEIHISLNPIHCIIIPFPLLRRKAIGLESVFNFLNVSRQKLQLHPVWSISIIHKSNVTHDFKE